MSPMLFFQDHPESEKEVMFRRRLPFTQIAFATVLGVAGGVYIYKPYFQQEPKTSEEKNLDVPKKQNETD